MQLRRIPCDALHNLEPQSAWLSKQYHAFFPLVADAILGLCLHLITACSIRYADPLSGNEQWRLQATAPPVQPTPLSVLLSSRLIILVRPTPRAVSRSEPQDLPMCVSRWHCLSVAQRLSETCAESVRLGRSLNELCYKCVQKDHLNAQGPSLALVP